MVSVGAEETTDVSVVGKPPSAVPFAFTAGFCAEAGGALVVVEATTDVSSVGNFVAAGLAVIEGDGNADAAAIGVGSGDSATGLLC